jgi:hypothetical protein
MHDRMGSVRRSLKRKLVLPYNFFRSVRRNRTICEAHRHRDARTPADQQVTSILKSAVACSPGLSGSEPRAVPVM